MDTGRFDDASLVAQLLTCRTTLTLSCAAYLHIWLVSKLYIHYRKPGLCPVLKSLPSAKYQALGKGHLCRVPHSAKLGTRQIGLCRVSGTRQNKALGKAKRCPVPDTRQSWALGKEAPGITVPDTGLFAECLLFGTRQNIGFAECLGLALGKIFTLPSAKP